MDIHTATTLSVLIYLLLLLTTGYIIWIITKVHPLLVLPITYTFIIFSLYLSTLISQNGFINLIISIPLSITASLIFKTRFPKDNKHYPHASILILAVLTTLLFAFSRGPYLLYAFWYNTVGLPLLGGDEPKHLAVLTSLISSKKFTLPFPYDPQIHFSYYYFYYLLPAIVLRLFNTAYNGGVWYIHTLLTQLSFFLVFSYLVSRITQKLSLSLLSFLLLVAGSSFKALPKIFNWYNTPEIAGIELWYRTQSTINNLSQVGWQVSSPITLAIWTPQHMFAATIALLLITTLLEGKPSTKGAILEGILITVVFGSSAFVGIAILTTVLLTALLKIKDAHYLKLSILAVFSFALLSLPLLWHLRTNNTNIVFQPLLASTPYLPKLVGIFHFYLIELGFLLPILAYLVFKYSVGPKQRKNIFALLVVGTFSPLVLSRLFQSAFFNDFGMRVSILYTVTAPLLFAFLYEKVKLSNCASKIIIGALFLSFTPNLHLTLLELYYRTDNFVPHNTEESKAYKAVLKYSSPNDIVLTNYTGLADTIPAITSRLTIQSVLPFFLEVYTPPRPYKKGKKNYKEYAKEICGIYQQTKEKNLPYRFVYLELQKYPGLDCVENTRVIYSDSTIILYQL